MKLSKREALLLIVLTIFALAFMEYQLVYLPGMARYEIIAAEDKKVQTEVNEINRMIANSPSIKAKKESTLAEIAVIAAPFYDHLNTDALLRTTHDLLIKSGMMPKSYVTTNVGAASITKAQSKLSDLTYKLKTLATDYASSSATVDKPTAAPKPMPAPVAKTAADKSGEMEMYSITISLSGNYDQLRQFISSIESLNKTIAVTTLSITSADASGMVDAAIMISFYGVQEIVSKVDTSNTWSQPEYVVGTGNPFSLVSLPTPTPTRTPVIPTPTPRSTAAIR